MDDLSGLTQLCNHSISSGGFFDACKIAKLKPPFKKGSKTELSINLFSTIYVKSYGKSNAWAGFHQHLKNHSADLFLPYLTDKMSNSFNTGLLTEMILVELQKVFETIDHNILIQKWQDLAF